MTTTHRFALRFTTDIGRVIRVSIPRARLDKGETEVRDSMEALLSTDAIATATAGIANGIDGAYRITTVTAPIE